VRRCQRGNGPDELRFTSSALTIRRPIELNHGGSEHWCSKTISVQYRNAPDSMARPCFVILLVSSLIAFLLSSRLRAIIAEPISQLANATRSVSETRDYGIRAQKLSGDELGALADGFNEMLARIQSQDSELRNALLAQEAALRTSQEIRDSLRTTLASIGDAVISTDASGRVVFVNPIAQSLCWDSPEADIVGRASR
jgi:nitrogen fixation/metabolism regulation signal transduction histidine kinase